MRMAPQTGRTRTIAQRKLLFTPDQSLKRLLQVEQAASGGDTARLSPEELLADALRAFKQDADSAAQRAFHSQSPSLHIPMDGAAGELQQQLPQSSSLPDLSKGAMPEQSPAGESASPATPEPGPGPQEQQIWGVLRPTPQRIGLSALALCSNCNCRLASFLIPCTPGHYHSQRDFCMHC